MLPPSAMCAERRLHLVNGFAALLLLAAPAAAQERADSAVHALDTVRVQTVRLRAGGTPLSRLPYAAQVIGGDAVPPAGAASVADLLRAAAGVSTASQFGSPLQPDVRFRGFQVGPVVGFPQSVSVFVDGVRINEPDASQVNWDLVPLHVVERIEVIRAPGGPFGRNTLAGAVNVVTRRGARGGTRGAAQASGASFGGAGAQGWAGGAGGRWDWLLGARRYRSQGWRQLSEASLRQVFARAGWRRGATDVSASYTFADSYVQGPGSLPRSWLRGHLPPALAGTRDPRRLQFTGFQGDWFDPRLHFGVVSARHAAGRGTEVHANAFVRSNRFIQANDNVTEPNVRGKTSIFSVGAAAQLVHERPSGAAWAGGVEFVRNRSDIRIFAEPNPAFPAAGGMTEDVGSVERSAGAFGHLWWPLSPGAGITASLRYDQVFLPVADRLDPENSGENTFRQLTGAVGAEVALAAGLRAFAGYGRGFRAPVILEVSCADPEDPCPLPFELGADPPLEPVTTDTWQAGVRWAGAGGAAVELVGYWAEVYDDLFAVVAVPSTRGYFKNLERTRRQGVELAATAGPHPAVQLRAGVGLVRATFQSEATLASALLGGDDDDGAPAVDGDGAVRVRPGNRFAMVPGVTAQAGITWSPRRWRFGVEASYTGRQHFVGDEDNRAEFGTLAPYLLLNGEAERAIGRVGVFARGQNLLGTEHETFGIIAPNVRGPDHHPQPFLTPGLPFRLEAGLRYAF